MVENLRAYFILYVITIKWTICVQENIELSCVLKTKVKLSQNFRISFLIYKYKATIKS